MKISDNAINQLVQNSFNNVYGARPLRRIIQKEIETEIANNILNNKYMNKKEVYIDTVDGLIQVD